VIPTLPEIADRFGLAALVVPLILAGVLTALVLLVPSVIGWFEDRNS